MNKEITSIDIEKVVVKDSLRKDSGDMESLVNSIKRIGVLHPIIIDPKNRLICGERRLSAARQAGRTSIPALRVDVDYNSMEALDIRSDENLCRKPLSPEELETHIRRKKSALSGDEEGAQGLFSGLKRAFGGKKQE